MKFSWPTKKLGEIFLIERGGSPRPIESFLTKEANGINWIKIGDTKNVTKYIYKTEEKIRPEGLKKSRLVQEGDFILSNSMSFGRPYIMKTTGAIHDGWLVLRKRLPDIDKDFFYYLLSSPLVFQQFDRLAAGSTVRNLNTQLVSNVVVPLPPLPEQHRIVKILDKAFGEIAMAKANTAKNLQNSRELFESYLQGVFAKPGKGWEEKSLEDVCDELFAGGDVPKDRFSKFKTAKYDIPIYANGIKDKGLYGYTDKARVTKPSITISARGTIGYSEIREKSFYPVVRLIVLIPEKRLIKLEFLHYVTRNMNFIKSGTSIPQLTIPMIEKYTFFLPPLPDQKAIVKKLDALAGEVKKLEAIYQQRLDNLEELKKSILKKAFAGELCVC